MERWKRKKATGTTLRSRFRSIPLATRTAAIWAKPTSTVPSRNARKPSTSTASSAAPFGSPARERRRKISNGSVAGNTIRFYGKRGC